MPKYLLCVDGMTEEAWGMDQALYGPFDSEEQAMAFRIPQELSKEYEDEVNEYPRSVVMVPDKPGYITRFAYIE